VERFIIEDTKLIALLKLNIAVYQFLWISKYKR